MVTQITTNYMTHFDDRRMAMKVECAHDKIEPLQKLIPNPRNPNNHPENQIELLAKIMKYQGVRNPIVVSNRSGFITKGHGRLLAAKLNNWDKFPVDYQDYTSEAAEYADMVADNKLAELAQSDMAMILEDAAKFKDDLPDLDILGIPDLSNLEPPSISDFEEDKTNKLKFYTCPHCDQEFEEKQAMVRVED